MSVLFFIVRKKTFITIIAVLFAVASLLTFPRRSVSAFSSDRAAEHQLTVIIDAGHGGEDGGAVSKGGIAESGLNLSIARKLELLLALLGTETKMTRENENAVYSESASTLREKKRSDLTNRVTFVNKTANAILISIHQNSLPKSTRVRGAQVFFAPTEGSESLALVIQNALNTYLNVGYEKQAKKIQNTIYLMNHIQAPAVLIECGFLSNDTDTELLQQDTYQKKLAAVIASGFFQRKNE